MTLLLLLVVYGIPTAALCLVLTGIGDAYATRRAWFDTWRTFGFSDDEDTPLQVKGRPVLLRRGWAKVEIGVKLHARPVHGAVAQAHGLSLRHQALWFEGGDRPEPDELLPWLSDGWLISIDPDDRVLLGHSLGGLFVLYAMTRHEAGGDDFLGNFVAFDPSVQVGDGVIFGLEQETSERLDDLRVDLFVGVGGATGADFVAWILGFAEQLEGRGYPGLRLRSEVVEGREHLELIEDMPELGLPWVFEQ